MEKGKILKENANTQKQTPVMALIHKYVNIHSDHTHDKNHSIHRIKLQNLDEGTTTSGLLWFFRVTQIWVVYRPYSRQQESSFYHQRVASRPIRWLIQALKSWSSLVDIWGPTQYNMDLILNFRKHNHIQNQHMKQAVLNGSGFHKRTITWQFPIQHRVRWQHSWKFSF